MWIAIKTTKMLKKNYEFRYVLKQGKSYYGENIKAFIIKSNKKNNYLGLAISTKFGKAVQRNKIKRLIRENYKNFEKNLLNGYSIVFIIKKETKLENIDFYQIKRDMNKIFYDAKLIKMEKVWKI